VLLISAFFYCLLLITLFFKSQNNKKYFILLNLLQKWLIHKIIKMISIITFIIKKIKFWNNFKMLLNSDSNIFQSGFKNIQSANKIKYTWIQFKKCQRPNKVFTRNQRCISKKALFDVNPNYCSVTWLLLFINSLMSKSIFYKKLRNKKRNS